MSILRRYVEKKISTNFRLPRHFDVVFLCNFGEQEIDVVSTYFVRRNFDEGNINDVSIHFYQPGFAERKINVVSVYFFGAI